MQKWIDYKKDYTKAMPRTRVSLNSKAHQLGWLKTKKL